MFNEYICPLCGHKNVKIEDYQDGYDWYKVTCENCFIFIIHESIFTQIADLNKDKEKNKRKRLNCVYNFLLEKPKFNGRYYYKFFYEESSKNLSTSEPVKINVASIIDNVPTNTKDKMNLVLKNLLNKYGVGKDVEVDDLDLGLMLIEEDGEMDSILKYFYDKNWIVATMVSGKEIKRFRLTMNAKIYLEEADGLENLKNTNITNITNNNTDNSIHINNVKNIKKTNIGQNESKVEKKANVNTNIETNIPREKKKWLFNWIRKKK